MTARGFLAKRKRNSLKLANEKGTLCKYFATSKRAYGELPARATSTSRLSRHKWHLSFLNTHRNEIRVFADVGAANTLGAPTAFTAKKALGRKTRVYAVDILKFDYEAAKNLMPKINSPTFETINDKIKIRKPRMLLKPTDIKPVLLAISRKPLTAKIPLCDAIRFTFVAGYMTPKDVRRSLYNISKSLRQYGYLLCEEVILQKTPQGFRVITNPLLQFWD